MGGIWQVETYHEDSDLTAKQRNIAREVIRELVKMPDPRLYNGAKGQVKALEDFSDKGFQNYHGYYCFKPSLNLRKKGVNIRMVFRLFCDGIQVMPEQGRIYGNPRKMQVDRVANRAVVYMQVEVVKTEEGV